jgi:hypothetical protein
MHVTRSLIAVAIAIASRAAVADPVCEQDAAALRAQLEGESARAWRWNTGWGVGFGAVAVGQVALAAARWNPFGPFDDDYKYTLYTGAGKAAIGALARLVIPLRVEVPAPAADACDDARALRRVLEHAAKQERALFWTSHLGGLVVNLGGAAILAHETSWGVAAIAFAIGYPVGLASTYTMPRGSWHAWRALQAATLVPVPVPGGAAVMLAGSF